MHPAIRPHKYFLSRLLLLLCFFLSSCLAKFPPSVFPPATLLPPSDAVSLLSFKSKADLDNRLLFNLNERFDYCVWQGVSCDQGRVVRLAFQGFSLRGVFPPDSLARLDQLRVLSLKNNSLSGPIPDLSGLVNLKSLFLERNSFSGYFPASIVSLHRLRSLDLSHNNFTGPIPPRLSSLDRLSSLRLQWNRFNGSLPPLNQSSLQVFNVSGNNITGPIPVTAALSRFDASSFLWNPGLCGEVINRACGSRPPFFESSTTIPPPGPLTQGAQSQGTALSPPISLNKHKRTALILGFCIGCSVLILSVFIFLAFGKKQSNRRVPKQAMAASDIGSADARAEKTEVSNAVEDSNLGEKGRGIQRVRRSGKLVFSAGEVEAYTLEQLMRASAEMLGRGTIGTTYKAVMDNQLILSVKRLDVSKTAITSGEAFEQHMEAVGGLRHPNLVPLRAYFQAKEERLIVYDYQPNGSLFSLIHGSRSTRARPLHWTSCLKIAEDVAQGLAYIHQASRLVHGNLKSSNVLLGSDFEACLTDNCLAILAHSSSNDDPGTARYKAPETRKSIHQATPKSDVYAFGVLLLEILTGKHPSQHPFLVPADMPDWVCAMRDDDGGEDNRLGMLVEVAAICSLTSPEQRPVMQQVLKMIQEIKESVMAEDNNANAFHGFS